MRIGSAHVVAVRRLEETRQPRIFKMGVEEPERFLRKTEGVPAAGPIRMGEREKHAGMVIGIFDRIGHAAVDIERAHPAAAGRPPLIGNEGDAVVDQPVGRAIPAALLSTAKA